VRRIAAGRGWWIPLAVLTLANVAWQSRGGDAGLVVSAMRVGESFPDLVGFSPSNPRTPAMVRPRCTTVVVFDPGCPACREAARVESGGRRGTTWVTGRMDPELHAFARLLHPLSRVLVVGSILTELEVRAVPAAFVVDGEGYVVSVGGYGGTAPSPEQVAGCPYGGPPEVPFRPFGGARAFTG
jgi:hypothetical protein